jgi:energy-coupling factor transporter ATP-binding protein EcfA2
VIIHRVRVRRFRKLRDRDLVCGPGLNVVYGSNDAGKSTLHLAFAAALYPVSPTEVVTFAPWGEEQAGAIAIEFEADERHFVLHKDFRSRRVVLEGNGTRIEDAREVAREISAMLGLEGGKLFRATAHIRQWELAAVENEGREIGARLAQIVTGGDANAVKILSKLDERIKKLEVGLSRPASAPGPLKRDQEHVAALSAEEQRLAREIEEIERAAAERDRLVAQIGELEGRVADDAALLDANRELVGLEERVAALRRRAAELGSLLERIERARQDFESAERDEALQPTGPDPGALRRLQETEMKGRLLEEDHRRLLAQAAAGVEGSGPGEGAAPAVRPTWAAVAAAGAVLMGAAAVALLLTGHRTGGLLSLAVTVLLGAGAIAEWVRAGGDAATRAVEREAGRRQRERDAAERLDEVQRLAQEASQELHGLLEALGLRSVQEVVDRVARRQDASARRINAARVLQGLLGDRPADEIARDRRDVLLELESTDARRREPDLALRRLDPDSFQRRLVEADQRRRQLDAARANLQRLEGRLSGRSHEEDRARVVEELAAVSARLARMKRHTQVLRLTREVLLEAHRRTIIPGRALLEERASRYLRDITGGAYERVSVDPHTLVPRVWVGAPKEWTAVPEGALGSAAVDACYLALRLALVDVLCGDCRPPLFLDDPFLAYDAVRLDAASAFLKTLARDREIFLFTCREDFHPYADHLIVLEEVAGGVPEAVEPRRVP